MHFKLDFKVRLLNELNQRYGLGDMHAFSFNLSNFTCFEHLVVDLNILVANGEQHYLFFCFQMSRDSGTSKQKKRGPIEKRTQGPNLATNTASIDPSFSSASNNESKTIVMEPNNLKVAPVLDSKAKGKRKSISKEVIKAGTGVNHISEDLTGMSPNGSIAGAYETESDEDMVKQLEAKRFEKIVKHRQIHPPIVPFYDSDTSDEDENTLGNIPLSWYDEYDHVGYDRNGQKIPKPAAKDEIDAFLENKNYVYDSNLNQVRLTKEELELLDRIQRHQFPSGFNPYENQVEYFTSTPEVMPLSGTHEPKRRFIPSKSEGRMIMKIAAKIRQARLKPPVVKTITPSVYDIWNDEPQGKPRNRIQAPKVALPEHLESYNPPSEYLLTEQEEKEWQEMDPEDRTHQFLPRNHDSLRNVGSYPRFIQERFERCLDLYLCPRTIKQKLDIDPESLIPKLPSPKELKPFPTKLSITYKGHSEKIRTICVDPSGQWLASGSDDASVKIWEVSSGRIIKTIKFESSIMSVAWNTNSTISILAVTSGTCVYLVNPGCYTKEVEENTFQVIHDVLTSIGDSSNNNILWSKCNDEDCYIKLEFNKVSLSKLECPTFRMASKGRLFCYCLP